jgi:hypothetical protein
MRRERDNELREEEEEKNERKSLGPVWQPEKQ